LQRAPKQPNDTMNAQVRSMSRLLLRQLRGRPEPVPFLVPVDPVALSLPAYYNIIKNPMDFGTITKKLRYRSKYKTLKDFAHDVRLTLTNAMLYDQTGSQIWCMAEQLLRVFEEEYNELKVNVGLDIKYDPPPPKDERLYKSELVCKRAAANHTGNRWKLEEKKELEWRLHSLNATQVKQMVQKFQLQPNEKNEVEINLDRVSDPVLAELSTYLNTITNHNIPQVSVNVNANPTQLKRDPLNTGIPELIPIVDAHLLEHPLQNKSALIDCESIVPPAQVISTKQSNQINQSLD